MSFNEDTEKLEDYIRWEHKLPIDDADMSMMTRFYDQ